MAVQHLPAVASAAPLMMIQHTFPTMWTLLWGWLAGAFMGAGAMAWFKNRGTKGMIADVKSDVKYIKDTLHVQKAPAIPVVPAPAPVA